MSHRLSMPRLFSNNIASTETDSGNKDHNTSADNPSKQRRADLFDEVWTGPSCFLDGTAVFAAAAGGRSGFAFGFLGGAAAYAAGG